MTRDELIAAMEAVVAVKAVPIQVTGWGDGNLYLRELTLEDVEQQATDPTDEGFRLKAARNIARILCDKDGKRFFDARSDEDIARILDQPWRILQQVIDANNVRNKEINEGN